MINLKLDIQGTVQAAKALGAYPKQIAKALGDAKSAALKAGKNTAATLVPQDYWLKGSDVKKAITLRKSKNTATMMIRGPRRTLASYKLLPNRPTKKRRPLTAAVKKEGGMKSLGPAFLIRSGSKYIPMYRVNRTRLPIRALYGPAIPQTVKQYAQEIEEASNAEVQKVFWAKVTSYINSGKFARK